MELYRAAPYYKKDVRKGHVFYKMHFNRESASIKQAVMF